LTDFVARYLCYAFHRAHRRADSRHAALQYRFYEKVIKVKDDVAAILISFLL